MDTMDTNKYQSLYDGNTVTIYEKTIVNNFRSKEEGDIIYEKVPYVKIQSPGQRHSTVNRKVTADDKIKFKDLWEAYENKQEMMSAGQPLREWGELLPEMVANCEHHQIYTVEALANVPDGNLDNLGALAREMRTKAQKYLENKLPNSVELLARIEELENQLKDATAANPDEIEYQDDFINDSTDGTE